MRVTLIITLIFSLISCKTHKYIDYDYELKKNLISIQMFELIGETKIDTSSIKAVKSYFFEFNHNGKIKDSTLIEYQNFSDYSIPIPQHTTYEIKRDSLGRDFERYATRVETGETYLDRRKIYGANSRLLEKIGYTGEGEIHSKTFYFYDRLGRLMETKKYYGYFFLDKPILERKKIFEYSDQTLTKEIEFSSGVSSGEFESKTIYEYNDKRLLINYRAETLENDSVVNFWGFKSFYNDKRLIKKEHYDSNGEKFITRYKYNSSNLPIEIYSFNVKSNKPTQLIKHFYLENKNQHTTRRMINCLLYVKILYKLRLSH